VLPGREIDQFKVQSSRFNVRNSEENTTHKGLNIKAVDLEP
jgi:hypothetical protein